MAIPQLYHKIRLDMRQANQYHARCLLNTMIANPHYCDHIRAIFVGGCSQDIRYNQINLPLDMLRKIYIVVSLAHNLEIFE